MLRTACVRLTAGLILNCSFLPATASADQVRRPAATAPASSPSASRPAPPEGFEWHKFAAEKIEVLRPKKWYVTQLSSKDTKGYRIGKEKPDEQFLTGLTINVVRNVREKSKIEPSLYAAHYTQEYVKGAIVVAEPKLDRFGPFVRIRFEVVKKIETAADPDRLFHTRLSVIANDKTGTLYVVIFGAPKQDWEEAWKVGKVMMNPMFFDDSI